MMNLSSEDLLSKHNQRTSNLHGDYDSQDLANVGEQFKGSRINLGTNHGLSSLHPDEWKNIPVCVVGAMKLIIENNEGLEAKIRTLNHKIDQIKLKGNNQQSKQEKEIGRRDESLRQEITAVERQARDAIEKKYGELNKVLQTVIVKQDHFISSWQLDLDRMNNKINKISLDFQNSALEQEHIIARAIQGELDKRIQLIDQRIDELINQNFHIPGLIGEYEKYPTFRDYCQKSHENFIKRLWKLEKTDTVTGDTFKTYQTQIDQKLEATQQFCEKELQSKFTSLKSDLDQISVNISKELGPQISFIRESFEGRLSVIETKLQQELVVLQKSYETVAGNTAESFVEQMTQFKQKTSQEFQTLYEGLLKECLRQTEEVKVKHVEFLEGKFFALDYKVEHIEKALEQSLDNFQAAKIQYQPPPAKQISQRKLTSSIQNSENSMAITTPQNPKTPIIQSSKRVFQANPQRYQEVKDKIDYLESQMNRVIDQLQGYLKPNVQQKHSEFQAMKDFQRGVKMLLDAKRVEKEIGKVSTPTVTELGSTKAKARTSSATEAEEDLYQKYWEKPESGFSKFRQQQIKRMRAESSNKLGNNTTKHASQTSSPQQSFVQVGNAMFLEVDNKQPIGRILTPQGQGNLSKMGSGIVTQLEMSKEQDPMPYQGKSLEQINKMKVFNQNSKPNLEVSRGQSQQSQNSRATLNKQASQKGPPKSQMNLGGSIYLFQQQQTSDNRASTSQQQSRLQHRQILHQHSSQDFDQLNISSVQLNIHPFHNRRPTTQLQNQRELIDEFKDLVGEPAPHTQNATILEEEAQNAQTMSYSSVRDNTKSMEVIIKPKKSSERVVNVYYESMSQLDKFKKV